MKTTMIGLILSTAMAVSAFAQGYSQPVREIEKAARSAVRGTCDVSIDAGYSGNLANCTMADFNQNLGETVPAGKILVIEDINATCSKSNADLTTVLNFRTGGNSWKPVPLQLVRTLSWARAYRGFGRRPGGHLAGSFPAGAIVPRGGPLLEYPRRQPRAVQTA